MELAPGVVTSGHKSPAILEAEVARLHLPDLRGKTVLDINSWDGYFAFEAERLGAARVVALDRMMWAMDLGGWNTYCQGCRERNEPPRPFQESPYWHPEALPGKAGFDVAHAALGSHVETVVADFMEMDVDRLGQFDVVFFLGTLYHMADPFEALRRLARVTRGLAIIETEAICIPGLEHRALWEFFPSNELAGDSSNWWSPNERALLGMCSAAGFTEARMVGSTLLHGRRSVVRRTLEAMGLKRRKEDATVARYRAVVHATKRG